MWQPKEELVDVLLGMGISRNAAERALLNTNNSSADLAAAWLFDNPGLSNSEDPLSEEEIKKCTASLINVEESSEEDDDEIELPEGYDGPYKMVFVINTELKMGVGKIAAQVAHASLGLYRVLIDKEMQESKELGPLTQWEEYDGSRKIALKGESKQHLLDLKAAATAAGLLCHIVRDAGHTQVAPGSHTVLSIFGKEEELNQVTGKLKLL